MAPHIATCTAAARDLRFWRVPRLEGVVIGVDIFVIIIVVFITAIVEGQKMLGCVTDRLLEAHRTSYFSKFNLEDRSMYWYGRRTNIK